jgi:cell division initiation protein
MRINPIDIHEQTFSTSFRGFDQVEVDTFLNHVAEEMERLLDEKKAMEIVDKAKEDARIVMNQAELVAERLTDEAREKAHDIRRDIQTLKDRKATLLAELSGLAHSLNQWVDRIDEKDVNADEEVAKYVYDAVEEPTPLIRLATENAEEEPAGQPATDILNEEAETFDVNDEQGDYIDPRELLMDKEDEEL